MGGANIVQERDNLSTRYLLGELEDPEEEQVELRLLTDPDYAEEFDRAVDDIIERYIAGQFEGPQLERVRNYFFQADERLEKLRFAMALKERGSRKPLPEEKHEQRWRWYMPVAASILIVIGVGLFVWNTRRSQPDLNDGLVALQKAFREERPVEGRLSDFNYVPLPNQRGGTGKVDYVQRDIASTLLLKSVRDNPSAASHQAAAKYYLMLHEFEQADKEFTAALALEPQNAKIHSDYGAALLEEGRSEAANDTNQVELYGRSLEQIQQALQLDNSLLEAQFNRALVLQAMRPGDQAKEAWNDYLKKDSSSPWADEARKNIRIIEQQQRGAVNGAENVEAFRKALNDADDTAAWKLISGSYTSTGNDITNDLIDRLLGTEPAVNQLDESATIASLSYVAKLERNRGDRFTSDLINHYQRAGPKLRLILAQAHYHMQAADASFQQSQFRKAINEYNKAKLNYQQAGDSAGMAFVEFRLAHCYVLLPNPQQAELAFNRLLTNCERKQYRWLAAQSLAGLAHAIGDASEYSKAIKYSVEALTKFEQVGDANGALRCLNQLADFSLSINQITTALDHLRQSLALTATSSEPKQVWTTFTEVGFCMTALKLWPAALFYHKEALQLAKQLNIPLLISRSSSYVGSTYASMQLYPDAVNEATQAFEIGQSRGDRTGTEMMAQASLELGDIYRQAGKCDEALTHYEYSLQLYQELNFDFHSYVAHKGKLDCFLASSSNQAVRDELPIVLKLSESYRKKITEESERLSFFDAEQEVFDVAIDYEFSVEQDQIKALQYSEQSRARALLDDLEGGRRGGAARDRNSPIVTLPSTIAEIRRRMPGQSQIVQYAVLDNKVVVWVITPADIRYEVVPINERELVSRVNAFLTEVGRPPEIEDSGKQDGGIELYKLLIQPIERYLDRDRFLLIVPDKILNYLPFAALRSPATSHYLIEDYDLGAAASATLFVALSAAAEQKAGTRDETVLSIGNPKFDRHLFKSLRDLPASLEESKAVAGLYAKPTLLLRDQATESATRAALEKSAVAHLAMHFVVNEQSERLSGFPLTPEASNGAGVDRFDGFLQSYEISSLKLNHLRLVVLSACQTGIERQYGGEGAVGAARPFLIAGVPTVVASLWPVDSDASAALMVKFHEHWRDGLRVTQALQQAQLELIHGADERYRHPYYWAPFLTIGGIANN